MRVKNFYLGIFVTLALCGGVSAFAANYLFTDSEKAAFAFFHYTKNTPDFENWVKNSPRHINAPLPEKDTILEQELLRLRWGFATLDSSREDLLIKTDILFQIRRTTGTEFLNFKFINSGNEEVPYFPYPYGREWIAVVVNNLADYTTVPLNTNEAARIHQFIKDEQVHRGTVEIRVRPVSADNTAPMKLDGAEQWLMLGSVSGIEFFTPASNNTNVSLWRYTDKKFLTETEQMLMPLLQ